MLCLHPKRVARRGADARLLHMSERQFDPVSH
jgi:hypothetical protein